MSGVRSMSETLSHTSTEWAPWHVIPADRKWFAGIATAAVLVGALIDLDPPLPRGGCRAAARPRGGERTAGSRSGGRWAADPNRG
ncbi:MAG: hypothetical protein JST59_11225 [Actinobacteria bacterium]|nr:hypothetical protein [Actinomycetota bacterium]